MANVLDKFMQWGENEGKPDGNSGMNKKAYNNLLAYLKEIKQQGTTTQDLAGQVYQLTEQNHKKFEHLQKEMETEREFVQNAKSDTHIQQLIHHTELIKRQMDSLTKLLKEVHNQQMQISSTTESVENTITYEELQELQEAWQHFEQQIEEQIAKLQAKMAKQTTELTNIMRDEVAKQVVAIQEQISPNLSNQEVKLDKIEKISQELVEMISAQLEKAYTIEEMKQVVEEGLANQKDIISIAIKAELYGFRGDLAEAVREEIAGYNTSVKTMYDGSKQVFQDTLGNYERVINKEITLVQEMLEDKMNKRHNSMVNEIKHLQKATKGYSLVAVFMSIVALVILIVDIFVLK